ncbi:hypothetical protein NUM3379_24060 [Kineococcus sp. NUM-3379]
MVLVVFVVPRAPVLPGTSVAPVPEVVRVPVVGPAGAVVVVGHRADGEAVLLGHDGSGARGFSAATGSVAVRLPQRHTPRGYFSRRWTATAERSPEYTRGVCA